MKELLGFVAIGLSFGFCLVFVLRVYANDAESRDLRRLAKACASSGEEVDPGEDRWGTRRELAVDRSEYWVEAVVSSAGRDRRFGTGDDLQSRVRDYKKAKIASEWVGRKSKTASEGFLKGFREGEK